MRTLLKYEFAEEIFHEELEPIREELTRIQNSRALDREGRIGWWGNNPANIERYTQLMNTQNEINVRNPFDYIDPVLCEFGNGAYKVRITSTYVFASYEAGDDDGGVEEFVDIYDDYMEFFNDFRMFDLFTFIQNVDLGEGD